MTENTITIRDNLNEIYPDVYTAEVLSALAALTPFEGLSKSNSVFGADLAQNDFSSPTQPLCGLVIT